MTPTLNIIGTGRVGETLAHLWTKQGGMRVQAVYNREVYHSHDFVAGLRRGSVATELAAMPPADVWLLSVPDTQIALVAAQLAALPQLKKAMAWHCSGFLSSDELAPLQRRGWTAASVHPALSFAWRSQAEQAFPGTVCALEGDNVAVANAHAAFTAIGGRCFRLQAADKPLYHGAAVFASNFAPVLASVATELWQGSGLPTEWVIELVNSFLQRAVANVERRGPREALTGPAARGDLAVVQAQAEAMAARDPALGQAYAALSALAGRLAEEGHSLR